jgi:hypothetical protein
MAKTYGLDSWDQIQAIRYTWNLQLGAFNISRSWGWEPKTGTVSYEGKDKDGKPVKATYLRSKLGSQPDTVKNEIDPVYLARWTDEIIEETVRTPRNKLARTQEQTDHLVNELRSHFPDAWVEAGYRELIPALTNQESDRHILAAAVKVPYEVIVTYNLKHFPKESLRPHGITAKHPDEFLIDLYHIDSEIVVHELHQQGAALKKPHSIAEVLECLETCRCTQFVQLIRERLAL